MTYTVLDRDPSSGRVIADKTVQVVVESEHAWRGTTIRDGMNPKLVGSTQELRDGVVYSYEAEQRVNRQLSLNTKDAVTAITFPWLSPGFLPRARGGAYPGWREAAALTPDRVAISSSETVPCPSVRPAAGLCAVAGLASVTREERIEYDPRSLTGKYIGGVAVFGEIRNNGQIIQSFRADSLEFR